MSVSDDPLIGHKLGDYTIQSPIGRGGMAHVYQGFDEALGRYAAIKVMQINHDEHEEELTQRFVREARAAANLEHPNIVTVYQFGQTTDLYYMAMKLIEGETLLSILKQLRKDGTHLAPEKVISIIRQIGAALDYAHRNGVLHRDIKPSNIMLTPDGRAILTDFGLTMRIGSETTLGTAFGTPRYISPEQAMASHKAVPQSDIYSLGVVLYEMVTLRPPFDSDSPINLALSHISDPPPLPQSLRPDLPHPVQTVILKALEKDPEDRWQTATEMANALYDAYNGYEPDVSLVGVAEPLPSKTTGLVITQRSDSTTQFLPERVMVRRLRPRPKTSTVGAGLVLFGVIVAVLLGLASIRPSNRPVVAPVLPPTPLPIQRIRLIYSPDTFVIYNSLSQNVPFDALKGISFLNGDQSFAVTNFGLNPDPQRTFPVGQCFRIIRVGAPARATTPVPGSCLKVVSQYLLRSAPFWADNAPGEFLVKRNDTVLQTCSTRVNTCEFSLE